ncbi:uncharacterized protein LOC128873586 isoform X1 [Hylaeus volcanicus]|uniref:uncharacterized protein LOC128873586 isoform X1 n=2 Tax=Hylaeus volcanicus TaxID=313075 RepID=UPI0023B7BAED|nr:uncharacterized protein LOC128873586 isoform X1 [Hylaeus volcanicus]
MANRKKTNEPSRSLSKNVRRHVDEVMFSSSTSSSEEEVSSGCRSCRNTSKEHFSRNRIESDTQIGQDTIRREENPFSFKHFLKNGSQTNYYNAGARPKVYSPLPTTSPNNLEKDSTVYSRNPTELPDFVQDHLVIEQCYLNHEPKQQAISDRDYLPDFAFSVEERQFRLESRITEPPMHDLPFDLTGSLDKGLTHTKQSVPNAVCATDLNLPVYDKPNTGSTERPQPSGSCKIILSIDNYRITRIHIYLYVYIIFYHSGFPLDLPIPGTESVTGSDIAANETNVSKSLPDFLNDGPIHNRTTLLSIDFGTITNSVEFTERRLSLENERLRYELELARKQIGDKSKRIQLLESELASRREVEHEETVHLEKAMEQVEDNLKRSTRRAVNAESTVTSLKKEMKALTIEVSRLRLENKELKNGCTTKSRKECGGSSSIDLRVRRLANDLRTAASSAEVSLRQLMFGVDNLRELASALENVDRIEDRTKDFLPDSDEDNVAAVAAAAAAADPVL